MGTGRLGIGELLDVVHDWASQPHRWQPLLQCLPAERWSGLLHVEDAFDLWVLTWPVQTGTQLHDHGESAGAFEVVSGSLDEVYVRRRERRRILGPGSRVAFPARAVHDVRNAGRGGGEHAVSLHAYSPPLTSMTFYERHGGSLQPTHSEPVAVPPLLLAAAAGSELAGACR